MSPPKMAAMGPMMALAGGGRNSAMAAAVSRMPLKISTGFPLVNLATAVPRLTGWQFNTRSSIRPDIGAGFKAETLFG